jgi:hypothetical protein
MAKNYGVTINLQDSRLGRLTRFMLSKKLCRSKRPSPTPDGNTIMHLPCLVVLGTRAFRQFLLWQSPSSSYISIPLSKYLVLHLINHWGLILHRRMSRYVKTNLFTYKMRGFGMITYR